MEPVGTSGYDRRKKGGGMRYKLIDVKRYHEDDVEFGTCELCIWIGSLDYDTLILEDELGNKHEVETGEWDWGDFYEDIQINNYISFAEFISNRDYPIPTKNHTIRHIVMDMARDLEK